MYFTLQQLKIPKTTKETGSFQIQLIDSSDNTVIEQILGEVTFKPLPGSLKLASITTNSTSQNYINL